MHKTGSTSSDSMGSLGRDFVARIPIDLNCSPLSSKTTTSSSQPPSHRLLINGPSSVVTADGTSVVRCRIDSDSAPPGVDDRRPEAHVVTSSPREAMTSVSDVSVRNWSTSSDGRETTTTTGSILKRPDFAAAASSQTLSSDRSRQRTPQGRRRVRFTNNVSLYRFDSDGVDSAYSSSDYERLYAPLSAAVRRSGPPGKYSATSTVSIPGNTQSNAKHCPVADETYDSVPRSVAGRRFPDDRPFPFTSPGIKQEFRGPSRVLHGTPSGSLYLRNNPDKTSPTPSVHWFSRPSPTTTLASQRQGPVAVGSSSALRAISYALVSDPVTMEKRLVITARLGDAFHPNDITIKANKNGSKIRIVSTKSPGHHRGHQSVLGASRHQLLNEQVLLPVQVDPYKLTARLDPNGSLLIEAPFAV